MSRRNRRSEAQRLSDDSLCREFEKMEEIRIKKLSGGGFKELKLQRIQPLTDTQKQVFEEFEINDNMVLYGCAGTGKTFLMMYLALKQILEKKKFERLIIIRSAVETRSMGFLPGTLEEKIDVYKSPYISICAELFGFAEAYKRLEDRGIIEFMSSSYLRGLTFCNSIILIDEFQNDGFQELDSIITRTGINSRVIFSGDFEQSDLQKDREKQGTRDFINILSKMKEFRFIHFTVEDIVRSQLIKSYIIKKQSVLYEKSD